MTDRRDPHIMDAIAELARSSPPAPSYEEVEARSEFGSSSVRPIGVRPPRPRRSPVLVTVIAAAIAGILIVAATVLAARTSVVDEPETAPSPSTTLAPTTTEAAPPSRDDQLQGLTARGAPPHDPVGVSAAVLFPGDDRWVGTAGLADRVAGTPIEPADRFEVGSITKTFMAALTLRLAEDGIVDLDAPIAPYLPDFPAADRTTLRHLLGHRAGVDDPTADLVSDRDGPPDPTRVFTPDELLAAAAPGSPHFEPGSGHDYSNANYWVLGAVLESATGRSIAELLDEYVFTPLRLDDTLFYDDSLPATEVVNAYMDLDLDGTPDPTGTAPLPGFVTPAWTAGGAISTADDLVHFLSALFAGDLIGPDSLDAMLDTNSGGKLYALGIYQSSFRWGHDGGIAGYLSAVFHNPETGVTVAVLTNRFGPNAPQADVLARRLADLADELTD
jgi:D-alanyl-D-alanine carboxypeptidase